MKILSPLLALLATAASLLAQAATPTKPDGLKEASWLLKNKNLLVIGPSGTGVSGDFGINWASLDDEKFHSLSCFGKTCWAIGGKGNLGFWVIK